MEPRDPLFERFAAVRRATLALTEPLEPEDFVLQGMPDASPPKWHLAHTTWFFERFLLAERPGYTPFDPTFDHLFNSYYEGVGTFHPRPKRGLLSRPTLEKVLAYRASVDRQVLELAKGGLSAKEREILEIGIQHEQQHQELLLTDIKYNFSCHPFLPAYRFKSSVVESHGTVDAPDWLEIDRGIYRVGHEDFAFCYDNERAAHDVALPGCRIAKRCVTNGEFLAFMNDGGYQRFDLWLSEGWDLVKREGWCAPAYWIKRDGAWHEYTLDGLVPLNPSAPVCHVSYFEADAFARWAGCRLPTEFEWEVAARAFPVAGNFVESRWLRPVAQTQPAFYGDVWQWTSSSYAPYPGFRPLEGALAEYNGKFMCNQYVLRGGSCASPASHIRATYRNFFPPHARWQFSGIRLAQDIR